MKPMEMPRNSPIGFVIAFFASVTGFALIWHIWWMAILAFSEPPSRCSCSAGATIASARLAGRRSRATRTGPAEA